MSSIRAQGSRLLIWPALAAGVMAITIGAVSPTPTTRAPSKPDANAAPPPPRAYVVARDRILAQGRQAASLIVSGDAVALHRQFTSAFASQVSEAQLSEILGQVLAAAPVGRRLGDSALPEAPTNGLYLADHVHGGGTLALRLAFDANGRITSGLIQPSQPLPTDPKAGYRLRTKLRLPFTGTWLVFWGGDTPWQNYHVIAPDQRHAFDFVAWKDGGTHRGTGSRNSDYWAWNRTVVAPAAGVVIEAVDGVADNRPQVERENTAAPAGNHVLLDLGHREYALIAHLRNGTVKVKAGQRVRVGQLLGRCGNSGNSSEPHIHFHLQDGPTLFTNATGLPVVFNAYAANGARVDRGSPLQGQFVQPRTAR